MEKETLIANITDTGMALMPLVKGIAKRIGQQSGDMGLRYVQVMILDIIHQKGVVSMGELSDAISIAKANTTPLIHEMIEKGLIQRQKSEADKRVVMIEMTKEGKQLQQRLFQTSMSYVKGMLDSLAEEELIRLDEALTTILDVASKGKEQSSGR